MLIVWQQMNFNFLIRQKMQTKIDFFLETQQLIPEEMRLIPLLTMGFL